MNDSQFWDKKAQHFQDTMEEGRTETKENLMRYLKENGMVFAKARVMDVGCGTGRYAVEFLKEKMYVTALDISEKMLEFAKINMSSISDNYDIIHSEWSNISSAQLTKGGKYDLVFASNSPGIRSYDDIKKMCEISRKYCFINKFAHRTDHLKEAFSNCIGLKNSEKEKSYLGVLEHIKNLGYKPVYEFANQWWADKVSVETAVENYVDFQKLNGILISDNDKKILTEYAHSIKDENGLLEEKTTAEAIWIKWEV